MAVKQRYCYLGVAVGLAIIAISGYCYVQYLGWSPCILSCQTAFPYDQQPESSCQQNYLWQRFTICKGNCQYFGEPALQITHDHVLATFGSNHIMRCTADDAAVAATAGPTTSSESLRGGVSSGSNSVSNDRSLPIAKDKTSPTDP